MAIHPSPWRGRLTGVVLICVGAAFLLDQSGFVPIRDLWRYWPLVLVGAGLVRVAGATTARDTMGGSWSILIGVWLLANFEGWFGMDFDNSWPFLLIAWGITLLFSPAVFARSARLRNDDTQEQEHRHAP